MLNLYLIIGFCMVVCGLLYGDCLQNALDGIKDETVVYKVIAISISCAVTMLTIFIWPLPVLAGIYMGCREDQENNEEGEM